MIPEKIQEILCCPGQCKGTLSYAAKDGYFKCRTCGHIYDFKNGIPDLRPVKSIRMPGIYNDPHYKNYLDNLADIQDYFYRSGGLISWVQNAGHRRIRSLTEEKKGGVTLDLGCGDGAHCSFMSNPSNYFGVDVDQKSLEKLKNSLKDFFVVCADAYDLPIKDRGVDRIVNIYNLEHIAYLDLMLEEMMRVLRPSGDVFISVPNEGGFMWSLGRSMTSLRKLTTSARNYARAIEISHINCIWQLDKAIRRYFSIKKRYFFPFYLPNFDINLITTYHCIKKKKGNE